MACIFLFEFQAWNATTHTCPEGIELWNCTSGNSWVLHKYCPYSMEKKNQGQNRNAKKGPLARC